MLHSQASDLIQKNLGEPDSTNPCPSPLIQVKILRRPKQCDSQQQQQQQQQPPNASIDRQAIRANAPSDNLQSERSTTTIYDNDDEWPSIADASKTLGSQQQKYKNQQQKINVMKKPSSGSNADGKTSNSSHQNETSSSTINNHTAPVLGDSNKRQPAVIKSYKERADEYAKARLRILGSTFSEHEKPDDAAFK